jgi:hypothetical protein
MTATQWILVVVVTVPLAFVVTNRLRRDVAALVLAVAPGNCTLGDFFRTGWPLVIISFSMLLAGMVFFWHL